MTTKATAKKSSSCANCDELRAQVQEEANKAIRWGETLRIIGDVLGVDYDDHDAVIAAFKVRIGVKYIAGIDKIPDDVDESDVAESDMRPGHRDRPTSPGTTVQTHNPVGQLMELCTKRRWREPVWDFSQTGEPHMPSFACHVSISDSGMDAWGKGASKQEAKRQAAILVLKAIFEKRS